jgi:hypothetical protein
MSNLNNYEIATALKDEVATTDTFVRIVSGRRTGTIGKITDVRTLYFSDHEYQISVKGRKRFWAKGSVLKLEHKFTGDTCFVEDTTTIPQHTDLQGRELHRGQTIVYPHFVSGAGIQMVMGTINKVSKTGTLYMKPFSIDGKIDCEAHSMRVSVPGRAMIIDRQTVDVAMMAKLSCSH